ncbi:hypothetical protein GGR51DRAFT_437356 [Nemania sp. FL0031]|nr:hypothetical protein GGR51DRAFT_437356 [Nemania sp. FL0031]
MPGQGHPGPPVGLGGIGLGASPAQMAAARSGKAGVMNFSQASPSPQPRMNSPATPSIPSPMNGGVISHTIPTPNGTILSTNKGA